MLLPTVLSISIGAAIGALFRWYLSLSLNSVFPTIPLGTLIANLIGGFLMGIFMAITKDHKIISEEGPLTFPCAFLTRDIKRAISSQLFLKIPMEISMENYDNLAVIIDKTSIGYDLGTILQERTRGALVNYTGYATVHLAMKLGEHKI